MNLSLESKSKLHIKLRVCVCILDTRRQIFLIIKIQVLFKLMNVINYFLKCSTLILMQHVICKVTVKTPEPFTPHLFNSFLKTLQTKP